MMQLLCSTYKKLTLKFLQIMNFLNNSAKKLISSQSVASKYEFAESVQRSFGDAAQFIFRFSVARLADIADSVLSAIRHNEPTLIQCIKTYGSDKVTALLCAHITAMLRDIGESEYFDERSVYLIAAGIERNAEARMLTLANVINFFYDARIGKINFFCSRLNVRHFMRAFAQYATEQREIEKRIHLLSEQQRQREIQTQHDAGTHTWEQYCAARGIDTSLSVEAYLMQQIESK